MQRILPAETVASAPFQSWLHAQNLSGADIFIGMNPLREGSRNRTKEHIRAIRHAYLDLDEEAGASLQAIRTSGDVPSPNFVLDTSPGKHQVVWRIEGLDTNQAEGFLRALAAQYGGDPAATDITRLLRIPGFLNRKYHEKFVVRAIHESNQVYHVQDFALDEDSPEAPRYLGDAGGSPRRTPKGHRSQSEADWAYAKRAIARGDSPQQIIQRIADYRSEDKADPLYYARHTVAKAQGDFARNPQPDSSELSRQHLRHKDTRTDSRPIEPNDDRIAHKR